MAIGCCCSIRTGVLFLGFLLGTMEVSLWVFFYTFRMEFREAAGYKVKSELEEDLLALSVIVGVDLIVNILLIAGANKDYSGRRQDLRRWGFMVPWLVIYGLNIMGLFSGAIFLFYSLEAGFKSLGLVPLSLAISLLLGHFTVLHFFLEQRSYYLSGALDNIVYSGQSSPT